MPELIEIPDPNVYIAYGVYLLKSKHRLVNRLKQYYQPTAHGHRTWQASFLLMDYLEHYPPKRRSTVMDVGCGWSPVGVFCASHYKTKVTAVDKDANVFPYMELLAALNDVSITQCVSRFERITTKQLGEHQLVMGADICFWDEMVKPMSNMVNRAMRGGTERVVIADPGRPTFYELVDLCNRKWNTELRSWYSLEPNRFAGEILEVKP